MPPLSSSAQLATVFSAGKARRQASGAFSSKPAKLVWRVRVRVQATLPPTSLSRQSPDARVAAVSIAAKAGPPARTRRLNRAIPRMALQFEPPTQSLAPLGSNAKPANSVGAARQIDRAA